MSEEKKIEDFSLEEICEWLADRYSPKAIAERLSIAFYHRANKCTHNEIMRKAFKRDCFILDDLAKGKYDKEWK